MGRGWVWQIDVALEDTLPAAVRIKVIVRVGLGFGVHQVKISKADV